MWSKQDPERADAVFAESDRRFNLTHPHAETIHKGQVWRVHGQGTSTIGWVRFTPKSSGKQQWHLYYDSRDAEGNREWCWTFDTFNSAVAYAVQHAGAMRKHAQR